MKTDFVHTENKGFKSHLISCFEDCEELFFSVAFASRQGLGQIKNEFEELMKSGGAARFCFDVTQGMTDPDVIEELATYPGESSVRMLFYNGRNKGFGHSKIYQFKYTDEQATAIVGSSNLSIGGFNNNSESSLSVTDKISDGVNSKIREYLNNQWNAQHSFDLLSNPSIFSDYRRIYEMRNKKTENDRNVSHGLKDLIKAVKAENIVSEIKKVDWYYLLGLLVANSNFQTKESLDAKKLIFRFSSNVLNTNNTHKGYIANEIDGVILGGIRLPQNVTNRKHMKRISERVFSWLKKIDPDAQYEEEINEVKTLTYNFSVRLPSSTTFSDKLFATLNRHLRVLDGKMEQFVPDQVETISKQDFLNFVKGYSDFRGRLSVADRTGTLGKLRIALQVNSADTVFLNSLAYNMEKKLGYEVNVSDGTARGRDNMLRVTATHSTVDMFASGWRRRMANEFSIFNQV